jgi:hypothetical protein
MLFLVSLTQVKLSAQLCECVLSCVLLSNMKLVKKGDSQMCVCEKVSDKNQ